MNIIYNIISIVYIFTNICNFSLFKTTDISKGRMLLTLGLQNVDRKDSFTSSSNPGGMQMVIWAKKLPLNWGEGNACCLNFKSILKEK